MRLGFDPAPIQAYLAELGYPLDPARLVESERQIPSALCYVRHNGHVLMLKRLKEPFAGHWTAPGGKLKQGERPVDAVIREMKEETGLTVSGLELKLVCSETGADRYYNWLLFVFTAREFQGELIPCDEGELRWVPLEDLKRFRLPDIDRKILHYVLEESGAPRFMRVAYAADHTVASLDVEPLESYCD